MAPEVTWPPNHRRFVAGTAACRATGAGELRIAATLARGGCGAEIAEGFLGANARQVFRR
jgi:hypothetical protein